MTEDVVELDEVLLDAAFEVLPVEVDETLLIEVTLEATDDVAAHVELCPFTQYLFFVNLKVIVKYSIS